MDLAKALELEPELRRSCGERPEVHERAAGDAPGAGGPGPARLHPRGRGRDRAEEPLTNYVPLYRDPKTEDDHHAVRHGPPGGVRPAEDGLPGPEDPDPDRRTRCGCSRARAGLRPATSSPRTTRRPSPARRRARPPASSSSRPRHAGRAASCKPDRIEDLIALNALYRPGPMERHRPVHRRQARPRARSATRSRTWSRSSRRPTGSSSTRSRCMQIAPSWPASPWARRTSCAGPWARRSPR